MTGNGTRQTAKPAFQPDRLFTDCHLGTATFVNDAALKFDRTGKGFVLDAASGQFGKVTQLHADAVQPLPLLAGIALDGLKHLATLIIRTGKDTGKKIRQY